ncbi:hypothetical protein LRS13_20840 [Svornostia abyssi]|uniref:Uncharacterized protein n=1 Tax=Svornostia abyssi TaxID=2898438 RepID=A0ABY5PFA8_9ACTN|nr:hypothetical protein LRS13_20840 [Parviterribacteraceae bacterium J379]
MAPKAEKNSAAGDHRDAERADAQEVGVDDGRGVVQAPPRDDRQQCGGEQPRREDARVAPAPLGPLDDAADQRGDSRGEQHGAQRVGPRGVGLARFAQHPGADGQGKETDRHVDEEDPAPVGLDEQPANRRPGRSGDGAHGGPAGDGDGPLLRRELGEQERQRGGEQERGADGLDDARGDERFDRSCGGARRARGGEERETQEEHALAAVRVGPPACGDEQRGEDDGVRVEHPAEPAEARARELRFQRREGDVHDEEVEACHERAEADDGDGESGTLRHDTHASRLGCVMQL